MNLVVLTGAGISAESGIRTFRASDGLWENHKIEDVATPEGFARDPERVQNFYNQRRRQLMSAEIRPKKARSASRWPDWWRMPANGSRASNHRGSRRTPGGPGASTGERLPTPFTNDLPPSLKPTFAHHAALGTSGS